MSKAKKRSSRKNKRDAEKAKRKFARRAVYAARVGTEDNRKSAQRSKRSRRMSRKHTHPDGPCGNGACALCHDSANPWLAPANSCLYRKRWNSPKWRSLGSEL